MNKQNLVWGAVAAVVLLVGVYFPIGGSTVVERVVREVGATPGSDFSGPAMTVGGLSEWSYAVPLKGTAASTTICVIKAPPTASSSLVYFGYFGTTGTGTAMLLKTYKSASPWLTTTQIGANVPLAANTYTASKATSTGLDSAGALFGASDYLVVTAVVAAGGAGTSSPTAGHCAAQFMGMP